MGREDNRLTLQGLGHRLEALERENAELRHKVAILEGSHTHRDELAALRGSDTRRIGERASELSESSESEGRVSRRWLLSKAGAAAVGTVAAGALLLRDSREANADTSIFDGVSANWVEAFNSSGIIPIYGEHLSGSALPAVEGLNNSSGPG